MNRHRNKVIGVYTKLAARYGEPTATHPKGDPLNVLVETILSQHTSDRNSHRAYLTLRKTFPAWADVIAASPRAVERAIKSGGLARQKSVRIQTVLRQIYNREGSLNLDRLQSLSTDEAYTYLTTLPGVGGKTACCVLLFALNRNVMPVDTHIHRIVKRLGWIPSKATPDDARAVLEKGLADGHCYRLHVLLIAHGRQTCTARSPACGACPIRRHCKSVKTDREE